MVKCLQMMYDFGVTVALFAFMPVKGTRLEKFPPPEMAVWQRLLNSFKAKACALDEVSAVPIGREELEQAICNGFCEIMKINLCQSVLTAQEKSLMEKVKEKYQSTEWTKKR